MYQASRISSLSSGFYHIYPVVEIQLKWYVQDLLFFLQSVHFSFSFSVTLSFDFYLNVFLFDEYLFFFFSWNHTLINHLEIPYTASWPEYFSIPPKSTLSSLYFPLLKTPQSPTCVAHILTEPWLNSQWLALYRKPSSFPPIPLNPHPCQKPLIAKNYISASLSQFLKTLFK